MRALTIISILCLFSAALSNAAGDWPQWRGPNRDGHAATDEKFTLQKLEKPEAKWRIPIGGGFSSPIVHKGLVFYLDEKDGKEVANCAQLADGKKLWSTPYADVYQDEWGAGPRSTPFTDGEKIWAHSCNGEFRCFSAKDGKVLWGFSFEDFGVKFLGSKAREGTASRRGNNGSALLDGDAVIVPVGATNGATLVCLNKDTGKLIWKSGEDEAAYSSLMVANLAGARQVVAYAGDALLGADRITGKVLWRVPLKTNAKRHTGTPVIFGNNIMVNSHTFGVICFEITRQGSDFKAVQKWRNPDLKINLASPVIVGSHFYTHGESKNFVCGNIADGVRTWSAPGFGKETSSVLAIGKDLLVLTDAGEFVVAEADPNNYREKLRIQLCGKNWNHPALAEGMLLVRDQRELACYPTQ